MMASAEVINISDDDDDTADIQNTDAVEESLKKKKFKCLNPFCQSRENLIKAPEYVRRHYGVLSYPKKTRVCVQCSIEGKQELNYLVDCLSSDKIILAETLHPPPKDVICFAESDSDPSDDEDSEESMFEFNHSDFSDVEDDKPFDIKKVIEGMCNELNIQKQITEGEAFIQNKVSELKVYSDNLNKEYDNIEKEINTIWREFYDTFRPVVTAINIKSEIIDPSLPPRGELERPELMPDDLVFASKYSPFGRWVEAVVISSDLIDENDENAPTFKIRYAKGKNAASSIFRYVSGKFLAYMAPAKTEIGVGTRIIARYSEETPNNASGYFYAGIIVERPTKVNSFRYLIFFDDGYAQYAVHNDIRIVVKSSQNVWEDIPDDSRDFIRDYLGSYPERPMVRLQTGNIVKTEWNGKWWKAKVLEVDGSLVKMLFPTYNRNEWIYRGSTRLFPLFTKKMNLEALNEQSKTARRRTLATGKLNHVVEYNTFGQDGLYEKENQDEISSEKEERKAVARKSTSGRAGTPPLEVQAQVVLEAKGTIKQIDLPCDIPHFTPHQCGHVCLGNNMDSIDKYKGNSPLMYPLLFHWRRIIKKLNKKVKGSSHICYVAPCGRQLRSPEEVLRFLRLTKSSLEIDCFSYDTNIEVCNVWEPYKKFIYITDMSYGRENIAIECINALDYAEPIKMIYSPVRLPIESVPLNLDTDFLVCCTCTDDCQDKKNCACWSLTLEGALKYDMSASRKSVGYSFRRLYDQVQTGIYECNTRCACQATCLNRVVQHPLRQKLQLFKTARRGWGVRTLNDIAKGSFICVYVGKLLTEDLANEEGKVMGGDDYYAELDFIEVTEKFKDDFEEDIASDEELDLHRPSSETNTGKNKKCKNSLSETKNRKERLDDKSYCCNIMADSDFTKRSKSTRRSKKLKLHEGDNQSIDESSRDSLQSGKSEDEDDDSDTPLRERHNFLALKQALLDDSENKYRSARDLFGIPNEVYIMDAKHTGNIGRYLNHSCSPNVFVQNVFVDTHDIRFPWITFFSSCNIQAGDELTWDYNYEVGTVPGKIKYCYCGAPKCRGRLL